MEVRTPEQKSRAGTPEQLSRAADRALQLTAFAFFVMHASSRGFAIWCERHSLLSWLAARSEAFAQDIGQRRTLRTWRLAIYHRALHRQALRLAADWHAHGSASMAAARHRAMVLAWADEASAWRRRVGSTARRPFAVRRRTEEAVRSAFATWRRANVLAARIMGVSGMHRSRSLHRGWAAALRMAALNGSAAFLARRSRRHALHRTRLLLSRWTQAALRCAAASSVRSRTHALRTGHAFSAWMAHAHRSLAWRRLAAFAARSSRSLAVARLQRASHRAEMRSSVALRLWTLAKGAARRSALGRWRSALRDSARRAHFRFTSEARGRARLLLRGWRTLGSYTEEASLVASGRARACRMDRARALSHWHGRSLELAARCAYGPAHARRVLLGRAIARWRSACDRWAAHDAACLTAAMHARRCALAVWGRGAAADLRMTLLQRSAGPRLDGRRRAAAYLRWVAWHADRLTRAVRAEARGALWLWRADVRRRIARASLRHERARLGTRLRLSQALQRWDRAVQTAHEHAQCRSRCRAAALAVIRRAGLARLRWVVAAWQGAHTAARQRARESRRWAERVAPSRERCSRRRLRCALRRWFASCPKERARIAARGALRTWHSAAAARTLRAALHQRLREHQLSRTLVVWVRDWWLHAMLPQLMARRTALQSGWAAWWLAMLRWHWEAQEMTLAAEWWHAIADPYFRAWHALCALARHRRRRRLAQQVTAESRELNRLAALAEAVEKWRRPCVRAAERRATAHLAVGQRLLRNWWAFAGLHRRKARVVTMARRSRLRRTLLGWGDYTFTREHRYGRYLERMAAAQQHVSHASRGGAQPPWVPPAAWPVIARGAPLASAAPEDGSLALLGGALTLNGTSPAPVRRGSPARGSPTKGSPTRGSPTKGSPARALTLRNATPPSPSKRDPGKAAAAASKPKLTARAGAPHAAALSR